MSTNQNVSKQLLFTVYLTRLFMTSSGLIIAGYALLGILLYNPPGLGPIFFPLIYSFWRELFYNFLGIFWIQFRYYLFIDYVPFSVLLLIYGLIQIVFAYYATFNFKFYFQLVYFILILEISFLPLGIISIYLLYNFFSINHSQAQDLLVEKDIFNKSTENKSAEIVFMLVVFNYVIILAFLNITRAIVKTHNIIIDIPLFLSIAVSIMVVFCTACIVGLLYINKKYFLMCSIILGLSSFIIYNGITLILYNFYSNVHSNINLLAPLSIFMIANAIIDINLFVTYRKTKFEIF